MFREWLAFASIEDVEARTRPPASDGQICVRSPRHRFTKCPECFVRRGCGCFAPDVIPRPCSRFPSTNPRWSPASWWFSRSRRAAPTFGCRTSSARTWFSSATNRRRSGERPAGAFSTSSSDRRRKNAVILLHSKTICYTNTVSSPPKPRRFSASGGRSAAGRDVFPP